MVDLGTLTRVDPRSVWPNEALDFTPWLAEHLDELGEVLGLDLELVERESSVGDFSADILAKDLGRDRVVVIENQLAATDHTHLGQLITYAAGLEAGVVVWVCRELREEHRLALDWLNRAKEGSSEFVGVIVELIAVDGSKPGVNFRPVAFPNEWSRGARASGAEEATGKLLAYQKFFQRLIDELRTTHKFTNARVGQPQNWYSFVSGVHGFKYSVSFASRGRVRTEIYIDTEDGDRNKQVLQTLRDQAETIEREFGERLEWEDLPGKRACRIACYRPGTIEDPQEQLDDYHAWAVDRLLRFKRVFGPRLLRFREPAAVASL